MAERPRNVVLSVKMFLTTKTKPVNAVKGSQTKTTGGSVSRKNEELKLTLACDEHALGMSSQYSAVP